jgi:lipid-binding SYLF domain-containing protein
MNTNWLRTASLASVTFLMMTMTAVSWSQDNTSDSDNRATQQTQESDKNTAKFDKKGEEGKTDIGKRLDNSAAVLEEIMKTPDKGIPTKILADAKCIIVVPSMINIAVGVGGRHGKGVATCRTPNGWSAPAPLTITGGSWGLQIGGEATDLVMLVMNQRGMDHLLSSKFKIGAEATGAAGPVGRNVSGETDWKMRSEVLTYSRSRGAFAGVDLTGAAIKQDKDETALLYGKFAPFESILSGKVPPPADSKVFLSTVRRYADMAEQNKSGE